MGKKLKAPVSQRAVLLRVNRKLAKEQETLRTWRTSGAQNSAAWEPGDLYRLDFNRNVLLDHCVDLEPFARELGVLSDWEEMVK